MQALTLSPIGIISSCYKEKFGIPRQSGLAPEATAELILNKEFSEECIRGLAGFSHIWISFVFHETQAQGWKAMVRPPRLGGNEKVGVFSSRSTFRPNPLGLSAVKLVNIEIIRSKVILHLAGCDLMDGTPVLDIKPYLPYADIIPEAKGGFAQDKPDISFQVYFTKTAQAQCDKATLRLNKDLETLIIQVLQLDPRPSYQQTKNTANKPSRIYTMKLYDFDLKWQYTDNNKINVIELI